MLPLKDVNLFRDNQAGLGFAVAPTSFERTDDHVVVEWVVQSQLLNQIKSLSLRHGLCMDRIEQLGCSA
jgi:hypothetical protein